MDSIAYVSIMKTDSSIYVRNTERNVRLLVLTGFSKSITYCTEEDFVYIKNRRIHSIHDPCHNRFKIVHNDVVDVYDDFHKQGIIDFINSEYDYGINEEEVTEIRFCDYNEED